MKGDGYRHVESHRWTRREAVAFLGGSVLAQPLTALAQQLSPSAADVPMPLIGALLPETGKAPFRQGLFDLGYNEGKNIRIEFRPVTPAGALPRLVAEFIQMKVNIIVASGSEATKIAKQATQTIPIVMAAASDPVGTGFVASLARPGGNITGLSLLNPELSGKRLQLLGEVSGHLAHAIVLWDPDDPPAAIALKETEIAAKILGIELLPFEVRKTEDFDPAFAAAAQKHAEGVDILPALFMRLNSPRIASWALQAKLPSIFWARDFPAAGGLMSYGPDIDSLIRRSADYVARILGGANPAEMPVEQPTAFNLVVNMKTAQALGLTFPPAILAGVTEIIE
jgi:putative ABC transport system substrate-binding protein